MTYSQTRHSRENTIYTFAQLTALNLKFELQGENIRVTPKNLLTDEIRQAVREHKAQIVEYLQIKDYLKTFAGNTEKHQEFEDECSERMAIILEDDARDYPNIETDVLTEARSRAEIETARRWMENTQY